jgi:hypothetical protein
MKTLIPIIFLTLAFLIIYAPIYWQRRKLSRIADEDLRLLNPAEWRKQQRSNVFIRFVNRLFWGLFILSGLIFNFQEIIVIGIKEVTVFVLLLGIGILVWAIYRFRHDLEKLRILE